MTSNVPATTIRIDPEVKREAVAVLDELGLVSANLKLTTFANASRRMR